jgi:hypothetical protein
MRRRSIRWSKIEPIARYFIFVGGTLAALLLIADWCPPAPPATFSHQLVIDRLIILIKSALKWPEKIVLDTSRPIITLPTPEEPPTAQSVWLPPDEAGDRSNLEAMAQLDPDPPLAAVDHPPCASIAVWQRSFDQSQWPEVPLHVGWQERKGAGGCCQFGWIDNGQTRSTAMSRRHIASSWSVGCSALTGGIER